MSDPPAPLLCGDRYRQRGQTDEWVVIAVLPYAAVRLSQVLTRGAVCIERTIYLDELARDWEPVNR